MVLDIYTIGGIDIITQTYRLLYFILGEDSYTSLVRFVVLFGLLYSFIAMIFYKEDLASIWRYMLIVTLLWGACFGIKADINIRDVKLKQDYVMSDVPFVPALAHSITSQLKMYFIDRIDANFGTGTVVVWSSTGAANNQFASTTAGYLNMGYGGYFDTYNTMKLMEFNKIADPDMVMYNSILDSYLYQCFVPQMAVMDQADVVASVMSSGNLITAIQPQVDQIINYNGITTCYELYDDLKFNWENIIKPKMDTPGFLAYLGVKEANTAAFSAVINDSLQAGAIDLSDAIGQVGTMKALDYAKTRYASDNNIVNADVAMVYNSGMAVQEQVNLGKTLGKSIREYIPYMGILTEALYIGLLPFTALLLLIPGNIKLIRMFLLTMLMVSMWEPTLALINGFITTSMVSQMRTALDASGGSGVLSFISYNTAMDVSDKLEGLSGFLALGAQTIVSSLIFAGEQSVMHALSNRVSGGIASGDTAKNIAPSVQNQRFAAEMGERYGAMAYYTQAGNMAALNALAYNKSLEQVGAKNMVQGGAGAYTYGVATGMGHQKFIDSHGLSYATENAYRGSEIGAATTSGTWSGYGGDTSKMLQTSNTSTMMQIGDAEYNSKMMNTGLFSSAAELQEFRNSGKITAAMAQKYGISENAKGSGILNSKTGSFDLMNAAWQEKQGETLHSYNFNGSQITDQFTANGVQHDITKGMNGDVVEHRAHQDLQENTTMFGRLIGAGAKVTHSLGVDGQGRTEIEGMIDGRKGTLVAQNGKMIFTESRAGSNVRDEQIMSKEYRNEQLNINRKLKEDSDNVLKQHNNINEEKYVDDRSKMKNYAQTLIEGKETIKHLNSLHLDMGNNPQNILEASANKDSVGGAFDAMAEHARVTNTGVDNKFYKNGYYKTLEADLKKFNASLVGEGSAYEASTTTKSVSDKVSAGASGSASVSVGAKVPGVGVQASATTFTQKEVAKSSSDNHTQNQDMILLQAQTDALLKKYKAGKINDAQLRDQYSASVAAYSKNKLDSTHSEFVPENKGNPPRNISEYKDKNPSPKIHK